MNLLPVSTPVFITRRVTVDALLGALSATVGFYWPWYEWERGQPKYAETDEVVTWCLACGILTNVIQHGANLVMPPGGLGLQTKVRAIQAGSLPCERRICP